MHTHYCSTVSDMISFPQLPAGGETASSVHICGEKSAFVLDSARFFFFLRSIALPIRLYTLFQTTLLPRPTARLGSADSHAWRQGMMRSASLSRRSRRAAERRQRRISCCRWKLQSDVSTSRFVLLEYIMFAASHSETFTNSGRS